MFEYLSFGQITRLISAAIDADEQEHLWWFWIIDGAPRGINFDEFAAKCKENDPQNNQSAENILENIEKIAGNVHFA